MPEFEERGNWGRYEMLVLNKLDVLDHRMTALEEGQVLVRIDVAKLKVKAGLWGAVAGLVPSMIGVALVILTGGASGGG